MINKFLRSKAGDSVLSERGDRRNIFRIKRSKNDHGFYVYFLENAAENKRIIIPRFVFGQFRACIRGILREELPKSHPEPFERSATFLNQEYFYFKSSRMDLENLIIQDVEERKGSSGYITVSRRCLGALDRLLYSDELRHPNDVLEEIISYHKLFQFSFVKGSKSITSDLNLRKDVLQNTHDYRPSLAERLPQRQDGKREKNKPVNAPQLGKPANNESKGTDLYKPKLGERFHEKNIKVDYGEIFGDKKVSLNLSVSADEDKGKKASRSQSLLSQFPVPLSALEIKSFDQGKFYFELSAEKSNEFRNRFLSDRYCDFYLGFEIVDTLFTLGKQLKTFQFPLYYMKIRIRESGRGVYIEARDDGRIYLNHLALANLVEKFGDRAAGADQIDHFFRTLLAQHISVDRLNDRVTLTRHLPVSDDIFDRTREVLFGYKHENGKGGILGELKFSGIECDLHSVLLYRAPTLLSPVDQALEHDLDKIYDIAHEQTKRFYRSLLGRFLTPEMRQDGGISDTNDSHFWVPGCLSKSTRSLLDRLNQHDLVLLEGPPGTGKTHTIMNLLIHNICKKKRVLIVSDQQAAIEALVEKMQDYFVGSDRGMPAEKSKKELLYSAVKVIDEVAAGESGLAEVVDGLSKVFKNIEPGIAPRRNKLEKKLHVISEKIISTTRCISDVMLAHMSDELPFEVIEPPKDRGSRHTSALPEFLGLIVNERKSIVDDFVRDRTYLLNDGLEMCFPFFKIPANDFTRELQRLREDEAVLRSMIEERTDDDYSFQRMIADFPRHEIIRYLENVMVDQMSSRSDDLGRGVGSKGIWKISSKKLSSFQQAVQRMSAMVQRQITLLEMSADWSENLWGLLRELHECIRLHDRPTRALALYYSFSSLPDVERRRRGVSIQAHLEQIDDLYQQRDKLVYESFVANLHDIALQVTTTKRGAGTNPQTRIMSLIDNLKQFDSLGESGAVFEEFKQVLYETFPIWIVRKQMVPLILPCVEQSFDLVIIDEATQCRVDDAMSLLYRAKKILVVGDDKQTVLQKNSSVDDYLFKDHELDEHLRSTQARGFKGGGSHIFALIKSIKQASVLLDEHYRCPAEIIDFSNKYVYDNALKVMQWTLPEYPSAVFVDDSEQCVESSKKPTSGKFKSIETGMIDRFFDFVAEKIAEIEETIGVPVRLETDVALCYFLLKNEPYVKFAKDRFIAKMNRGEDVLDGAGAALQGKERDYIFYLWDVTRYNLSAFTQGDDQDKRKGELNVLMSRPKKKAFHFLHRNFDQIDHSRSNISHYLWRTLLRQKRCPDPKKGEFEGASASLFADSLRFVLENSTQRGLIDICENVKDNNVDFRQNIVVGDARKVVDLVVFPNGHSGHVVGLVDLTGFNAEPNVGEEIVDYYFQLKRAAPKIDPVFMYPYELVDDNSQAFRSLSYKLDSMIGKKH